MQKHKAVYYGELELIPGILCDGYILDNGAAVMSLLGTAKLLSIHHRALQNIATNGIPKSLESFWNKDLNIATKIITVVAPNSHYKGRDVEVYGSQTIEAIIQAYAFSFASNLLRKNQEHIGKRCVFLMGALIRTALDAAIKEACGLHPKIQKTVQKNYLDAVELIQEFGFKCSVDNEIAIKKDIIDFLKVPQSTLNSFLYKHSYEIKPLKLSFDTIRSIGSKAKRMNGYHLKDVAKIAVGMDTEVGLKLKRRMFGEFGDFAKVHAKDEIHWREILSKIFAGFGLRYSYCIEKSRYIVDFFVADLLLCLECNGVSHKYYNTQEEKKREDVITEKYALVRFQPDTGLESLFNAILHAKPGKVIRLKSKHDCQKIFLNPSNN